MTEIKASIQINSSVDKVWNIVSDLDREPKFWNNITKARTISRENNVVKHEITIGKVDRCLQTVTLYPQEKIHGVYQGNNWWHKNNYTNTTR